MEPGLTTIAKISVNVTDRSSQTSIRPAMCIFQRAEINRTASFCLLASLLACAFGFEAAAASARTLRAKANLHKAQQKLQTAQQALDKVLAQAQEAETARQMATNAFLKAQQTAAAKYGAQLGVFAAVADRDALEGEVVKMRKSLTAALHETPEYRTATNQAEQARQRLLGLEDDKSLTEPERGALRTELSASQRRPYDMKRDALAGDTRLREAARQLQAAQQKVASVAEQVRKFVAADPAVSRAHDEARKAGDKLAKIRKDQERPQRDVTTAQGNVDRAASLYEQALAQDKRYNARHRRRSKRKSPRQAPMAGKLRR